MAAPVSRILRNIIPAGVMNTVENTSDPLAAMRRNIDRANSLPGYLDDGYNCPKCKNRGGFERLVESRGGYDVVREVCDCMTIRKNMIRLRNSGLAGGVKRCRFDNYDATEPWQATVLDTARRYVADGGDSWFFIGGAIGGGKTHICTAICGELMDKMPVQYAVWPAEIQRLRADQFDGEEYSARMDWLKSVDLLFVDDFMKIAAGKEPTSTDIRIAHELLNHRYVARKKTIISSERYSAEIMDIDQATGGRIQERAKGYTLNLKRERAKDYRMKLAGDLL